MSEQLLNTIAFAKRAGQLTVGFDAVIIAAQKGTLKLILTANDLSAKTLKELAFKLQTAGTPTIPIPVSMDEIWAKIGKRTGIIGIMEIGFTKKIKQILDEE